MFFCTGCQKEYESFSNFCIACGGKIEKKAEVPTESKYICCGCQKEYEPTTKFCSECGGKVEKRVFELITENKYICSGCQKEYDSATKFCSECGGKIVVQDVMVKRPAVTDAVSTVQNMNNSASAIPDTTVSNVAVLDQIVQLIAAGMCNPQIKTFANKKSENIYSFTVENALLKQTGDILIENDGKSKTARLISSRTSPSVMAWFFLVFPVTFWLMIPCWLLLIKPLYQKLMVTLAHNVNAALKHPYAYVLPEKTAFAPQGKSAFEIAQICFANMPQITPESFRVTLAGNLDNGALYGAMAGYAAGVVPENIICMIDSTPVGERPGTNGVVFAVDKIYYSYRVLKSTVAGTSDYENITGSFFTNANLKGNVFRYNVGTLNINSKNVFCLGQVAGEYTGDIPENILIFMEKILVLAKSISGNVSANGQSVISNQPVQSFQNNMMFGGSAAPVQNQPVQSVQNYAGNYTPGYSGGNNCVQVADNVYVKLSFWGRLCQKRISRRDYWLIVLLTVPLHFIPVVGTFVAFYIVYTASYGRLHDSDRSAWNLAWVFLPVIGDIIFIVLCCMSGTQGPNRFGAVPQRVFGGN